MEKKISVSIAVFLLLVILGCKKNVNSFILTTNLWVTNTDVNMAGVKIDPGRGIIYAEDSSVKYGAARQYALLRASIPIKIVNAADTTAVLYNSPVDFKSAFYTLFIVGQAPTAEIIINEETNFPFIAQDKIYTSADSVINVRFANLSPNCPAVNIKIQNSPNTDVVNLGYKGIANFKAYAALSTNTGYIFEIRDAQTNALLLTYNLGVTATNRFKNVALIIKGLQGTTTGTNAFGMMVVNYF